MKNRRFDIDCEQLLNYQIIDIPSFFDGLNICVDLVSSTGKGEATLTFSEVHSVKINGIPNQVEDCEPILDCFFVELSGQKLIDSLKENGWSYKSNADGTTLTKEPLGMTRIITSFYSLFILSSRVRMVLKS